MKVFYERMKKVLSVTGGGGDADLEGNPDEDEVAVYTRKLDAARKKVDLGNSSDVTVDKMVTWEKNGWFKMFEDRYVLSRDLMDVAGSDRNL
jgi:hypothetical protein